MAKLSTKKNNVYQIGTWFGIINMRLSRDVLQTTDTEFLDEVPNTIITLKTTTKRHSKFGEQGYQNTFVKHSTKQIYMLVRKIMYWVIQDAMKKPHVTKGKYFTYNVILNIW